MRRNAMWFFLAKILPWWLFRVISRGAHNRAHGMPMAWGGVHDAECCGYGDDSGESA